MEILTLLKANIRKKKSTFISILILTALIVAMMTSILAVRDNYNNALEDALEYADTGDITAYVQTELLTDEVRTKVEENELVESVQYIPAFCTNGGSVGDTYDGNGYFLMELVDGVRLYNDKLDGFEKVIPKPESGEIYLPLGLKSKLECNVGDTIHLNLIFGEYAEFTIKGFVQEPAQGSSSIGWKQIFISKEDYDKYYDLCHPLETEDVKFSFTMVRINQAEDSKLSVTKFQRQLNLETGIIDIGIGALNKDQTVRYSTLMPDVVTGIVLAFALLLFVIVLIVMSHSISTEIEIDYVTLGILKSQGFSKGKIRLLIILQYLLAQAFGIIVGVIFAAPIEKIISKVCQGITGVLPDIGLSFIKTVLCAVIILAVSALLILLKTKKVARISPVRAILGGQEEIFFDSRLNAPISKKTLSASLSFRQFVSAKKRYAGSIFIVAILVFCMVTVNLSGDLLSSRKGLSAMGLIIPDIELFYLDSYDMDCWDEVEEIIESHSAISDKNVQASQYVSLNGENLYCDMYQYPEDIPGIIKGRAPLYENEILITKMVADMLEIEMGDDVIVTAGNEESKFIVSGIYQSVSDSGMAFAMNFDGAEKFSIDTSYAYHYYIIEDKSQLTEIADDINEQYEGYLGMNVYEEGDIHVIGDYYDIVSLLKLIMYGFSIVFAFVVVRMVCVKTFIQERRDIGIYKALGFTSDRLRRGFGIRFLIVAILGSVIGTILSLLLSAKVLSAVLSMVGLSRIVLDYSLTAVLIPVIAISISFFVFAYITSYKIKKVEVRELVIE